MLPVSRTMKSLYNTVRIGGIACNILPKNFPTLKILELAVVKEKSLNFGGYGGCGDMTRKGKYIKPFIVINLRSNKNIADCMATLAHEMLHVKQTYCEQVAPSHGNAFRADCAKFAAILGLTYYHVNGYDKPTLHGFKAKAEKLMQAFLADHADRKKKKS